MPESRLRRKGGGYTHPPTKSSGPKPNGRLFAPVMCGLLIAGLLWVVTYYITQGKYPIPGIEDWNLVAGFGVLLLGFGLLTRWR